MTDTRVLVLVGSLRADSLNRKIAEAIREQAPAGVTVDIADGPRRAPVLQRGHRRRAGARGRRPRSASRSPPPTGVLVVTPEYNGTMPAVLNNAIDWVSRPFGDGAIKGKPLAVVGTTPTPYGGQWAHDDTRKSAARSPVPPSSRTSSLSQSTRRGRRARRRRVRRDVRRRGGRPRVVRRRSRRCLTPDRLRSGVVAELHDLTALEQGDAGPTR